MQQLQQRECNSGNNVNATVAYDCNAPDRVRFLFDVASASTLEAVTRACKYARARVAGRLSA